MKVVALNLHDSVPQPQTLAEAQQIIDLLWEQVRTLNSELDKLREQVESNSRNSSRSPSQDGPKDRANRSNKEPTGRSKGAQSGHAQHTRPLEPEENVTQFERYFPNGRCGCGGTVEMDETPNQRHQVFDLPEIRYTVTEHQRYGGVCQSCGQRHQARYPQNVPTGQMGAGLRAWLAVMSGQYRQTTRQLQQLLAAQWGLRFSLGAISEAQAAVGHWLTPLYLQIGEAVRTSPLAHADETPHYRAGKAAWLWTLCTDHLVYFMPHASRGQKAARQLLMNFKGLLVTDRHGGYNLHPASQRQLCWAHLIRNLERMAGRKGEAGKLGHWLVRMARLIVRAEHLWQRSHYRSALYKRRLEKLRDNFKTELKNGVAQHPGQRTGNECQRLLQDEPMFWTFLRHPGTPLTNNTAERALRPYVIWRKTSFFTQSTRGDQFRPVILSVTETCRRLGVDAYQLVRQVCEQGLRGEPITITLPITQPAHLLTG